MFGDKGAKALEVLANWAKDGLVPTDLDYPSCVALFVSGKAGFMLNGVWEVPTMVDAKAKGKLGFDYGVVPLPALFGNHSTWVDSHGLAIPYSSKKPIPPEKVKAVLKFMAYVEEHAIIWAQGGHIPAYLPVVNSQAYKQLRPNSDYAAAAERVVYDPRTWAGGAAGPIEAASAKHFPAAIKGQLPISKALDMFGKEVEKIMNSTPR